MEYPDEKKIPHGTVIDEKYRVESLIGKGGMGGVYEAVQLAISRKVALKHLYPRYAGNDKAFVRFRQEAMAAASIGHDNICEVTDLGIGMDGAPYLVMPLLRGVTVHDLIRREGTLAPKRVSDIGCQILSALGAAHGAGIIHRDLKPANVFVTRLGDRVDFVKLLDFGVSKVISDTMSSDLTRTGEVVGTPHYMAPEQAKGERRMGPAVDIYAAGVILYEMLTRRRPFDGESYNEVMYKILTEPCRPPSELNPMISADLEAVISRSMSKEARDRYPDAASMRDALEKAASSRVRGSSASIAPTAVIPSLVDRRPLWKSREVAASGGSLAPNKVGTPVSTGAIGTKPTPSRQSRYLAETWYYYKGKELLLRDYSGLDPERSERVIESSLLSTHDMVLEGKKGILMLVDMTGWTADRRSVEKMKKIAGLLRSHADRLAAVGVSGIQTILINSMRRESGLDIQIFDTREEAMDWLAG